MLLWEIFEARFVRYVIRIQRSGSDDSDLARQTLTSRMLTPKLNAGVYRVQDLKAPNSRVGNFSTPFSVLRGYE